MANLEKTGVELVAQGAAAYVADIGKAAQATDKFAKEATDAAARVARSTAGMGDGAKRAGDLYQDEAGRWRTTSGRFASDAEKAAQGVTSATSKMAQASGGHFGALSEIATGALRKIGEVAISALGMAAQATGKFLADSVTSAADVEQTLNVLGATSGATAAQLEQVRDRAIALGGDLDLPNASAQDAAEAMLELSKAGFTVQESMDAAKGTLQLAAAAQISAGDAAAISAQAINAFGLEAKDAARVADLLAGGANASSASMTDLSQGLQQGGFAFDAAGQHIEDLVTSLAALTNVGLTGSDAGTALKNAMMRLMNPTEKAAKLMNRLGIDAYDATGKMKPWPEVLENIRKATAGMSDEQRNAALGTIFLSDGMKAMIPLLDMSAEEYAKLQGEVTKAGSAQAVAGAQTVGFNGAIAGLKSQMETLQLIIGTKLLPLLTPLIQQFSGVMSAVGSVTMALVDAGAGSSEFLESLGLLDGALGLLPGTTEGVYTALVSLGATAQQVATSAMGGLQIAVAAVQPYLAQLASFITTAVIPAALEVWSVFNAQVIPILLNLATAVLPLIPAALQIVASFWMNILMPALTVAWSFFKDNMLPILAQVASFLASTLPPTIQMVADFLSNTLFPAINTVYTFLFNSFLPALRNLAMLGFVVVAQEVLNLASQLNTALQPAFTAVSSFINSTAKPALDSLAPIMRTVSGVAGSVAGGFDGIARAINSAIDAVKRFIDAAANIKVPPLVTPGSPTPLEIGLDGISRSATAAGTAMAKAFAPALASIPDAGRIFGTDTRTAPIAAPTVNNRSSSTSNKTINYQPVYNGVAKATPSLDAIMARGLAL